MKKRAIALFVALVMAVGMLPTSAWASDTVVVSDADVKVTTNANEAQEKSTTTAQGTERKENTGGTPTKTQSQAVAAEGDTDSPAAMASNTIKWDISEDCIEDVLEPEPATLYTNEEYYFNIWWSEDIHVTGVKLYIKEPGEDKYTCELDQTDDNGSYYNSVHGEYCPTEFYYAGTLSYYWELTYTSGITQKLSVTSVTVERGYNFIYGLYQYYDEDDDAYETGCNYSTKARTINLDLFADEGSLQYKSNNSKIKVNSKGKITIPKKYAGIAIITVTAPKTSNFLKNTEKIWVFAYPQKTTIKKLTSPKKKQLKVTWNKISSCNGYYVSYRLKGSGEWKKLVINKKSTSAVVKGLKSKKKYEVDVAAYVKNGSGSCWTYSKTKTIKVK